MSKANALKVKQPVAEAVGAFMQRFLSELRFRKVPDTSIQHYYHDALKKFVNDPAVRPILGEAFTTGCQQIDFEQLQHIWTEHFLQEGWQFPAEKFDWERVAWDYLEAVQGIVKGHPELRALLLADLAIKDTDHLRRIAEGVAPRAVSFDLQSYRNAILEQYGALQLESLGSAKFEREGVNYRGVPLWGIFVAQNLRECQEYLPQNYEIPKEQLRRLQLAGEVEALEELEVENRKQRYFQQSQRPLFEVLGVRPDSEQVQPLAPYLVILGDPGSGKSTLLRYLAVTWARQGQDVQIPLLIELRGYIQSREDDHDCQDFLEFVHRGSNWVGHLDQGQLEQRLLRGDALVMFDGLDEVVDRQQRGMVLKQIHSFTQRYPQVAVVVTSRVIGYNAESLRGAGFQHYMLQDLDAAQIQDFLQRWHELTYGDASERQRKQERIRRAIADSRAIQELAGNPLLLTLMAILNRGEELPQDRARLYEKASEVLLYQWDVEAKLLKDPRLEKYTVEIDHRDKQAMLRRVAAKMQNSEKGLAGNFIRREDLEACLKDYLKTTKEAQNAPSIAAVMIDQLRERNFILCYVGAKGYAFVHRTFLEYFCATEIKERFDKRDVAGGLTYDQLQDEVFGQHWQDETWHEVLRLLAGMIPEQFVGKLIQWLIQQEIILTDFLDDKNRLQKEGLTHLLLAADCLAELRDHSEILEISRELLKILQVEVENEYPYWFSAEAAKLSNCSGGIQNR